MTSDASIHRRLSLSMGQSQRSSFTMTMPPSKRVEGLISAFSSSAQFSVDGVSVDASQASFPDGTAGLGLGIRVAVEGTAGSGVLVAGKVQIKTETDVENQGFELAGAISAIDTAGKNFVRRGVTVDYSENEKKSFATSCGMGVPNPLATPRTSLLGRSDG